MSPRLLRTGVAALKLLVPLGALGYAGTLGLLYASQERLIFHGVPLPADYRFRFDQRFEEVGVPVAGATLDALHFIRTTRADWCSSCTATPATSRPGPPVSISIGA